MTTLTEEQSSALAEILAFLQDPAKQFFVLSGSAGTGKTFCIRHLPELIKGRFVYTAPTNKATKVLRQSVTTQDYKPECRTIFSLLGLKLEANGEVKELSAPEDPVDLSQYKAIIVDEGSMVSEKLRLHIHKASNDYGVKFIFMGDPAQLPPVGEAKSPIWRIKERAVLRKVMRHDNQILELATRIRDSLESMAPNIKLASNHAEGEGVFVHTKDFGTKIAEAAREGRFSRPDDAKVIAWRNVAVDSYNTMIRKIIFDHPELPWLPDERVIFTAPAKDLEDKTVATTDDEGKIDRIAEGWHPEYADYKIWNLTITLDDNRQVMARVLHPDSEFQFNRKVNELAEAARAQPRQWRHYWDFKEAFHSLRYAYAITAHRAQGSTYDTAFVDWRDVLLNRNRHEAFQCLYVACTRPKRVLVLN